jgi:hypothetical protein
VGSSATNITVTVATTAASVSLPRFRPHPLVPPPLPLQRDLVIFGVILAGLAWAVRGWRQSGRSGRRGALATLAAGLLLTLVMAACGGGGGSSGSGPTNPGTPAGTYNLTVTGTAGSGSTALSHSVALTLTVT